MAALMREGDEVWSRRAADGVHREHIRVGGREYPCIAIHYQLAGSEIRLHIGQLPGKKCLYAFLVRDDDSVPRAEVDEILQSVEMKE